MRGQAHESTLAHSVSLATYERVKRIANEIGVRVMIRPSQLSHWV